MEELFRAHYEYLRKVAAHACRKYSLSREEVEDFIQTLFAKIVADDYAVLWKFRGEKCSLKTYLNVVVQRALLDHINHLWGKWRPSEEAKRLGPLAMLLEQLMIRDGYGWDAACQKLWIDHRVQATESELADLAIAAKLFNRLPRRPEVAEEEAGRGDPRRHTTDSAPNPLAAPVESADERVLREERRRCRDRVWAALEAAMATLTDEDRLIVRDHLHEFSVQDTAKRIGCDPKPLYRRIKGIWKKLRVHMMDHGINPEDVEDVLGHGDD
jgi:RNA polymerase sigma factor (sigma-70 family)